MYYIWRKTKYSQYVAPCSVVILCVRACVRLRERALVDHFDVEMPLFIQPFCWFIYLSSLEIDKSFQGVCDCTKLSRQQKFDFYSGFGIFITVYGVFIIV